MKIKNYPMSKKLGQHFLINKEKIGKIVEALDLKPNDIIVEIGPGHGELTEEFRIQNLEVGVIAVEKDKKLAENLKKKFARVQNIKIINEDIVKILPQIPKSYILNSKSYKIVGNIPYYITGYLLRILGELKKKPALIVLTIQKEVAERICAIRQVQGRPNMNLLAASVQFWAEPEIIDYISKRDFKPAPKVDSAIIRLQTTDYGLRTTVAKNKKAVVGCLSAVDSDKYYSFIKILFKQPRKTILNNLESGIKKLESEAENKQKLKKRLESTGINPNARPQDLSMEQIIELSTLFQ